MMRKNKLLICALAMSMVMTIMPGMTSKAAAAEGEPEAAVSEVSELQDENTQRLEEVTAMDEDGSIHEIDDTEGTVDEEEGVSGIAMFAARAFSPKVVNFNTKGNAITNYTDETNGISGYTNGAYGADAAYLGTTADGRIRFMLSGVTGTVNASEVQLVDYSSVAANVSYYTVSGGKLIHYISQDLNQTPTSSVNNGPAPSYLSEGGKYYSYDGHYFYTDYNVMLTDYQNSANGASAVNAGNAFNNYFQFLDMNLSTSYTGDELNNILNSAMVNAGIDPASSKLTGTGNSFVKHQNTYSVNALLSLGIAINESAWGRSSICLSKNNIFGLNAVDSSPNDAYAFPSIDDCIREFMNYQMANAYLKDGQWSNHGEYLGNKGGGINVSYASDPYWGEKAAAHAWNLDTLGGSRDYAGTDDTPTDEPETETPGTGNNTPTDEPETETPGTGNNTPTDEPETETPGTGNNTPADEPETETPGTGNNTPADEPETETPGTGDNAPADEPETETPGTDNNTPADEPTAETPGTDVNTPADEPTAEIPETDGSTSTVDQETETSKTDSTPTGVQITAASAENPQVTVTPVSDSKQVQTAARSPKTGDSATTALWIALLGGSAIGMVTLSLTMAKKRKVK